MFGNFTSQIKVFVWMSSNIGLEPFQVHLACAYMQHSTFTFFLYIWPLHAPTFHLQHLLLPFLLHTGHLTSACGHLQLQLSQQSHTMPSAVQCIVIISNPPVSLLSTHKNALYFILVLKLFRSTHKEWLSHIDCIVQFITITAPALTVFWQGCNALATVHSCIISQILG